MYSPPSYYIVQEIEQIKKVFSSKRENFNKFINKKPSRRHEMVFKKSNRNYLVIEATAPAPTVRPPSRIAKLVPSSIAIGEIKATVTVMLSPGITISVPSGRLQHQLRQLYGSRTVDGSL